MIRLTRQKLRETQSAGDAVAAGQYAEILGALEEMLEELQARQLGPQ